MESQMRTLEFPFGGTKQREQEEEEGQDGGARPPVAYYV